MLPSGNKENTWIWKYTNWQHRILHKECTEGYSRCNGRIHISVSTKILWRTREQRLTKNGRQHHATCQNYFLIGKWKRNPNVSPIMVKFGFLFIGRGIRIRTLNDGVRVRQCFIQNAHFKHISGLSYLSNVSVDFLRFFTRNYSNIFCFVVEQ